MKKEHIDSRLSLMMFADAFRKRRSFKVVDLMSSSSDSSQSCPAQAPIANLREFLVELLSPGPGVTERLSARDIDDAIGVFAVNGVKV